MSSTHTIHLDVPIQGLLSTPASRLPYQRDVLLRSFLLQRPTGNVVVYNSPGITAAAAAIRDLGGVSRLLMNHSHEAMYGQPELDAPVWVHASDRGEVVGSLEVAGVFDQRGMIDDDLEVIPTPGHTAGTTSYLWDDGTRRFLFTGDFIWIDNGEWKAVVLDPRLRNDYVRSLEIVRDLEFDFLVPWGATEGGLSYGPVKRRNEIRNRVDPIIERVRAGGNR